MTLDTRIYILDKVDPQETFAKCRELLGATDRHAWQDRDTSRFYRTGVRCVGNDLGQGLPALLDIKYRPGAALRTPEQATAHDEDCNLIGNPGYVAEWGPCDGNHMYRRACWLEVSVDTAYGYSDDRGYGCGDLHAELVSKLGMWLDERGVRWEWQNEFTGEIHTAVLPVIEAESKRGESR